MSRMYKWGIGVVTLSIIASCARENYPVATRDKCTLVKALRINKKSREAINNALALRIDTRRYKYNAKNFCAYNKPTSNGNCYLLTIFYRAGDHITPTWILLSQKQAIDTQLSDYEMAQTDSVAINGLIESRVNLLTGIDNISRKELINMMNLEARQERSQKK